MKKTHTAAAEAAAVTMKGHRTMKKTIVTAAAIAFAFALGTGTATAEDVRLSWEGDNAGIFVKASHEAEARFVQYDYLHVYVDEARGAVSCEWHEDGSATCD